MDFHGKHYASHMVVRSETTIHESAMAGWSASAAFSVSCVAGLQLSLSNGGAQPARIRVTYAFGPIFGGHVNPAISLEICTTDEEARRHAEAFADDLPRETLVGLLAKTEFTMVRYWSSALRDPVIARELCGLLNLATRSEQDRLVQAAVPLVATLNVYCVAERLAAAGPRFCGQRTTGCGEEAAFQPSPGAGMRNTSGGVTDATCSWRPPPFSGRPWTS